MSDSRSCEWSDEEMNKIDVRCLMEYAIRSKLSRTLSNTKSVCEKEGIPFNISVDDLKPYPLTCPVLGTPINWMATGSSGNDSPSIDRMIPDKGYVQGNVQLISQKANRLKGNASVQELKAILKYMEKGNGDDDTG